MRTAAYVRVSKEQAGQVSPDAQRSEILSYCQRKGWTVTEFFTDLDISGRTDRRPALQDMLRRAQDGEFDAVVFYRIDRLSREPMHHYAILAALAEANVQVDSVGLPLEDNPESAFMWDLSAALAKLESLRLGKRMRSAHRELARQGKYGSNLPPYGWRRVRDERHEQRLVLEPGEAAVRRQMHQWVADGWSIRRIAQELNERGIPSSRSGRWRECSVHRMLGAVVQIGARLLDGEEYITGAIEPLITREEYERTKAILASRKRWPERKSNRALRGNLVRCGHCGHALYLHRGTVANRYRCEGYQRHACERGVSIYESVLTRIVEPQVLRRLAHLRAPTRPPKPSVDITGLIEQEQAATAALGRLVAMYAAGEVSEDEWVSGRPAANKRLAGARARLAKARSELVAPEAVDYERLRGVTTELWHALSPDDQHQILTVLIDHIEVNRAGDPQRVRIFWR